MFLNFLIDFSVTFPIHKGQFYKSTSFFLFGRRMILSENIIIDSIAVLLSRTIPKDLLSDSADFAADKWISRLAMPFSRATDDQ